MSQMDDIYCLNRCSMLLPLCMENTCRICQDREVCNCNREKMRNRDKLLNYIGIYTSDACMSARNATLIEISLFPALVRQETRNFTYTVVRNVLEQFLLLILDHLQGIGNKNFLTKIVSRQFYTNTLQIFPCISIINYHSIFPVLKQVQCKRVTV